MTDDLWEGMDIGPKPRTNSVRSWVPERLPEDVDAERSFLATVCAPGAGPAAREAVGMVQDEDFVHPGYRALLRAVRLVMKEDIPVDSLSLKDALQKTGELNKIGGYPGLVEALAGEDVERPSVLADVIIRKSRLRKLVHIGSDLVRDAAEECATPEEISSSVCEKLTRLATTQKIDVTDLSDLVDDVVEGRALTTQNGGRALSWGDPILDDLCPIPRGEPTIIAARPGCGKSALAIQVLCQSVAAGIAKPLFLSLEMGREKIKARVAAHLSQANSHLFRDAKYGASEIQKIIEAKDILKGIKTMFPKQQCSVEEIESLVVYAIERYGIDSVVLDQFSHVAEPRDARKESYAIKNAATSKRLTALAKNYNLGWVTLAQINKDGDDSRRPTLKDLAATDRLAQDAAVIVGLWNKGSDENQEVWGTIIKNRDDGHKGWHKQLAANYGTCTFRVMDKETTFGLPRF